MGDSPNLHRGVPTTRRKEIKPDPELAKRAFQGILFISGVHALGAIYQHAQAGDLSGLSVVESLIPKLKYLSGGVLIYEAAKEAIK